jgi:hypothetical protein
MGEPLSGLYRDGSMNYKGITLLSLKCKKKIIDAFLYSFLEAWSLVCALRCMNLICLDLGL